jgi:hypothetical protein
MLAFKKLHRWSTASDVQLRAGVRRRVPRNATNTETHRQRVLFQNVKQSTFAEQAAYGHDHFDENVARTSAPDWSIVDTRPRHTFLRNHQ